MDATEALELFSAINTWRRGDERAPHKPLLLLLALSQVNGPNGRWLAYRDIDAPLRQLLTEFGPSRKSYHPEYPYGRLRNDGLWQFAGDVDLETREGHTDPKKSELVDNDVHAGFTPELYETLRTNPTLVGHLAQGLLDAHFAPSMYEDILAAVGLTLEPSHGTRSFRLRDPRFREEVLRAYERACAVCGFDVMMGETTVGLDAAHIKWHQAGGPAEVRNGLCLCVLHHKLFDRGAFAVDDGHRVIVSELARGRAGFEEWLLDYHGREIRASLRPEYAPNDDYLEWHWEQVFKKPGRATR